MHIHVQVIKTIETDPEVKDANKGAAKLAAAAKDNDDSSSDDTDSTTDDGTESEGDGDDAEEEGQFVLL